MLGELTTVPGVEGSSGYKRKLLFKKLYITTKKEAKRKLKITSLSLNILYNFKQPIMFERTQKTVQEFNIKINILC